ncbi:hypothetical protein HNQ96_005154 [Aminobacter lissarensis]|uniref:Uncharacterized protein n=1 Tax=Aminobacter carboxidus TaxID=376165 RepID=A0A8E1WKW8_9HYPH|nr:hypothetical protein [Aminobacter lissarensis]MBB6469265.1 hypothetical protein [Aminobacter lissarensis]
MMETLGSLQEVLTLVATATGVYVAIGGLNAWRRETTGKRDIELCQTVIEKFYEAEHKMNVLRSPMSYVQEGESRAKEPGEPLSETERRNHLFTPLARYNAQADFWSEFFSYRFRMRALFGNEASEAFAPVDDAVRSFRATASTRYQALYRDKNGLSADSSRSFEQAIWSGTSKPDVIADQMREGIRLMEAICVPIVRATRPSSRLNEWGSKVKALFARRERQ